MSDMTSIEWTDSTWNPVTGCDRVSEGCDHCYALTLAKRLKAMGNPRYQRDGGPRSGPGFGVTLHPDKLEEPLRWRKSRRVFVNSMSDLFHEKVPLEFIVQVFAVMAQTRHHIFQILTKRPHRMARVLGQDGFPGLVREEMRCRGVASFAEWPLPNVWLGTSVENQKWASVRVPHLLRTPAAIRWLSCEPLLGPIEMSSVPTPNDASPQTALRCLDWVVVGGESGPRYRAVDLDWARSLRNQCVAAGVAFFFKQVGGSTPKAGGRLLDGRTWDEMPSVQEANLPLGRNAAIRVMVQPASIT